ncbi:hypothetical protein LYNGBM3L_30470 [Moorena producens 3L]|uniref:Uncharacterized protein n=1 Tax=Moorena producens 3L TaxID=489825 RepID=F4XU44_9CYAN|nr:hypothetical protein LYNGBM3L_30470 [Moorena producens 3L]OLT66511.1 hypothetical protein BI334_17160 [Moorena producens 3L]
MGSAADQSDQLPIPSQSTAHQLPGNRNWQDASSTKMPIPLGEHSSRAGILPAPTYIETGKMPVPLQSSNRCRVGSAADQSDQLPIPSQSTAHQLPAHYNE